MSAIKVIPKFVTLPNGVQLYTERVALTEPADSSETHTIVLIHGMGGSTSIFYPIYASLLSSFPSSTLLAYDQAGHGLSPIDPSKVHGGANPLAIDDIRSDLDALITQEAPTGRLSVIAHSAGTLITSYFLISSSPNVARISHAVFIGGPLSMPAPPEVTTMQLAFCSKVEKEGTSAIAEDVTPALVGKTSMQSRPVAVALVRSLLLGQPKDGYAAAIRAHSAFMKLGPFPFEKFPDALEVLFVGGEEDLFVSPDAMNTLSEKVRNSQVITLPAVGHTPQVEVPSEFVDVVAKFLKV
ncbi:unnamed protein product [Somion occarium]|uniref:AB hydrolase-1 domain-containing protein n=1 Tax=Somion occarium TaxID=3059160 RepID=A0ABP1E9D2_9APHY